MNDANCATIEPVSEGIQRPLWSVMIPTSNHADCLRETLISVLAQAPGPDVMQIEVIADSSTKDDPAAIVEELGCGRVQVYQQPHKVGSIKNLETCLQRSRGQLVHILHSGDGVLKSFYQTMANAFEQQPDIGAAFCRHIGMDADGHWQHFSRLEQSKSGVLDRWLETIATGQRLHPSAVVVRREVYEQLGGFDRRLAGGGDAWEMWVRIATQYPVWYEVEPLAVYRLNAAKTLTSRSARTGESIRGKRIATEIIESYLPTYLPQTAAQQATHQARKTYAHEALGTYDWPGTARQMLAESDWSAASALIREALTCSTSWEIVRALVKLMVGSGIRWCWKQIQTAIALCRQPEQLMEALIRPLILNASIQHLYGPKTIDYTIDELIVLCVVRNGELYIKSFIEHHLSLGVKHIVFLDNGSTDDTVALARTYDHVTVLQTQCPYRRYETLMKRYLVKRFSQHRWNLFCDIDELFDYPDSDKISLRSLLTYLNQHGYTAVVTQMLDLFAAQSLASLKSHKHDAIKQIYPYYDLSNIQKERYPYGVASNSAVNWHWGGIRKTLFGSHNYLTKAALVFVDDQIQLFVNCHQVNRAYIADFTCLLRHYPFLSSFYDKVLEAVKTDRYAMSASSEYELYWQRLETDPDLNLKQDTAQRLEHVNALIEQDFLVVSNQYRHWVRSRGVNTASLVAAARPHNASEYHD